MLFSEVERRELAEFFAKRFSDDSVRSLLARQAGIDRTTLYRLMEKHELSRGAFVA